MKDELQNNESLAIKAFSSLRRFRSSLNLTTPAFECNIQEISCDLS